MEKTEEVKIKELVSSPRQTCFNKAWLLQLNPPNNIEDFICLICKQVANSPVSIHCPQHQNLDELLIVGENCLKQFLGANSNLCPIELHSNCQYAKSKLTQRYIYELSIICPLQFEQDLETFNKNGIRCTFNGKIKELNDHLNNSCPFNQSECWFKSFGCNHKCLKSKLETHLISNIKFHFDLVIKSFNGLKQNLGLIQEEAKQLKLQNEKLKLELQSKHNKDGEYFASFKETLVLNKY
ncbi:hypothetical protein RFI_32476 [Reticulomyxa filosa]|uniref:TRAF-type domain-containing protein n=1 Tax=Reticulomyxa filosa TaxID=46433 RepID=X6LTG9_RETFI|nr:hypothetical protein RFI_32476 [Reticulomyxa filosa]|eukprot:ETO04919.1 hypothetical protein RFI_32476 [Reticulomyxa filosa]